MGVYKVGADSKAPAGLKKDDQVVTAGGTYIITGFNADGSYQKTFDPNGSTTKNYSGSYANITGSTNPASTNNGTTDFSAILKNLMGDNPTNYNSDIVSQVQSAFDARNQKIAGDPSLSKYANDDIMSAAQKYLDSAKNYNSTQSALQDIQDIGDKNYKSAYNSDIKDMLEKLLNMDEFSYDPESDPAYQAYATKYGILGDNAMNDTLGSAASLTGGLPSSAAVSAAAQAKNAYNSEITDIIPTLLQAAYSRYQGGIGNDMDLLSALSSLDSTAYSQFADDKGSDLNVAQWLANYGYNTSRDNISDEQYQQAFDYQVSRDKIEDSQWLSQFNEEQRQAIINEAINKGELSVSQGRLALSKAQYADDKSATEEDTSYYGGMYSEMMSSGDPEKWLAENGKYLNADEIAWLRKQMGSSSDSTSYFN